MKKTLFLFTLFLFLCISLVACSNNPEPTKYTIRFDSNGGSNVQNIMLEEGEKVVLPSNPTKDGYEFVGWYYKDELYQPDLMPNINITLVAKWEKSNTTKPVYYTITFDEQGGSDVENITLEEGRTFVLPTTIKEGYTFLGWYLNDEKYEVTTMSKENITLVAKWEEIYIEPTKYTITFDEQGGSDLEDIVGIEGSEVVLPTPIKEGYNFLGWYLGEVKYEATIMGSENITLVAKWEEIVVEDLEAPKFKFVEGFVKDAKLNWGKTLDQMAGITVEDNVDGDLTDKVVVTGTINNKKYGKYELTYTVQDEAGNEATLTREIEVYWNYEVGFIGHAGSYYGVMNSEQAFLKAVDDLQYQYLECDIKQTKDGVFVTSHDDTWGGVTIASTNWADLKDVEATSSRTQGYPSQYGETVGSYTSKICTLERYLEICKEYGAVAVIELKSSAGITNSDQSRMPALMAEIEKAGMLNQVIFLGSSYNCLIWVKQNGYSYIPCQYLVNSFESDTVYNRCVEYGLDVSINVTGNYSNSDEWLAKYKDAGIKVSTYTFTQWVDYNVVQEWIDKGVDFVTCDWQRMDKLVLPDRADSVYYNVTFKDADGTVLKETTVKQGKKAFAPEVTVAKGYEFIGWDKDITNVQSDMVVTAQYQKAEYSIEYILYGGSCSIALVDKYYYDSETIVLPTAEQMTIEKGKFIGWLDADGKVVTEIATGSTGDKVLYASWEMSEVAKMPLSVEDEKAINALYAAENKVVSIIVDPAATPSSAYVLSDNIVSVSTGYAGVKYNYGKNIFVDLATALENASEGDIIYVRTGIYATELNIGVANLIIAGPNYGIHGNNTRALEANVTGLTTITASGIEINGLQFSENGAIKVGANNTLITNIHMTASQVACNGNNRKGCIVDSANISDLTVSNSYINAPGTSNSYTTQFMSFTNVSNLSIIDNYITNTGQTTLNSSYGAMRIYHLGGKFICTGNEFRWQTTGYLLILGGSSNTCTEMNISDNIIAGYGSNPTAGISFSKAVPTNTTVTLVGNKWYNCSGSTLMFNASDKATFIIKYNYFDENTAFKANKDLNAQGATVTFDHNCYMTALSSGNLTVPNDTTTYDSLEELDDAYLEYKGNN